LIPVISILIPTRNRPEQLESLISIIQKCPDDRVEFLISDNSDSPSHHLSSFENVSFFRPERVLNMTEHWNFLFHKSKGKYITFVGDDDAFLPSSLVQLCSTLEAIEPDLVWTQAAGFGWPSSDSSGNFFQTTRRKIKRLELSKARTRLLKLDSLDLPIPYNYALVRREVILNFLNENPGENFFSSRVPDVNSGVKILFLAESQLHYQKLTFISGASPLSNGLLTRTQQGHPVSLEFNNPKFNPIAFRPDSKVKEISPFGFVTFFEAIEESLLQLGENLLCSDRVIAFRSVFLSSFPKQQLEISLRTWPRYRSLIQVAYLLHGLRKSRAVSILESVTNKVLSLTKILLRKESVVILKGPGLNNTASLIDYLEANIADFSRKMFVKIYVK
jgi:glycosyltransferase involved in cell wall biosynthesis